jgi:GNAT superfamily N-acetyltransferase
MTVSVVRERPDTADARLLIDELERYIAPMYPHDTEHGFSPEQLVTAGVAFFVARVDGKPAGCGGLKLHGTGYGEVMRMYVRPGYRGRGMGRRMLRHLEAFALEHGVNVLRLKTGIYQPEALGLYERSGYREIPPFGPYREHPLNKYYEKRIG